MNRDIVLHDLGLLDYQQAVDYQTKIFNKIIDQKLKNRKSVNKEITQNHLIFVEHPNVYTHWKKW